MYGLAKFCNSVGYSPIMLSGFVLKKTQMKSGILIIPGASTTNKNKKTTKSDSVVGSEWKSMSF